MNSKNKKILVFFVIVYLVLSILLLNNIKIADNVYILDYSNQIFWIMLVFLLLPLYVFFKSLNPSSQVSDKALSTFLSLTVIVIASLWLYLLYSFTGFF